jgi:hypothetical protein
MQADGERAPSAPTYGWGYTLYYATNFIFTGPRRRRGVPCAAVQHRRRGAGDALGGLGVALVLPGASLAALDHGAAGRDPGGGAVRRGLGADPGLAAGQARQPYRDHHDHVQLHRRGAPELHAGQRAAPEGSMDPATAKFPRPRTCPRCTICWAVRHRLLEGSRRPMSAFFIALLACVFVWLLIWRTRLGYEIRAFGHSETAAVYAGISPVRIIMIAMLISGALAGLMAINNVMGEAERLVLNAVRGGGLHRHRRGADGPQPPGRRGPRRASVRVSLPGRRGAGVVDEPSRAN